MNERSEAAIVGKRLKFLIKDSLLYGASATISRMVSIFTFPLLTRYFTVEAYGTINLFTTVSTFLAIAFVLGQDSAIARFYYAEDGIDYRKDVISQSFFFQALLLLIFLPFLYFNASGITHMLSKQETVSSICKIIILQTPAQVALNFSQNILKWTFKRKQFLIVSLGYTVTMMVAVVICIKWYRVDLYHFFLISAGVQMFFSIVGLFFVRTWITIPKSFTLLKPLLLYALPLGFVSIISSFVPVTERIFVNTLIGEKQLGLYSVAAAIASLISLFSQAFQMAWGPFSLSIYKEKDSALTYNLVLKLFALAIVLIAFAMSSVVAGLVHFLSSDKYLQSAVIVFPLSMALAVQATGWITEIGISFARKSMYSLYSYFAYLLMALVFIYLLGTLLGIFGVAMGLLLANIGRVLLSTYFAQKVHHLTLEFKKVFLFILLSAGIGSAFNFFFSEITYAFINPVLLCISILIGVGGWFFLFQKSERLKFRHLIITLRSKLSR